MKRILAITAGLSVAGVIVGGVVGAAVMLLVLLFPSGSSRVFWPAIGYAWLFGAALGSVLGPIAAWTLMRRVPIWRALLETAAGAALGAVVGLGILKYGGSDVLLPSALLGFVAAAVRLWFAHRVPVKR